MGRSYINKETGEHIELVPICPKCRAAIYWSLTSGVPGARSVAHCANNLAVTRVITDPRNMISCDWEGIVMRMEDNDVSIYNDKMRLVPYKIVRKQRRKP